MKTPPSFSFLLPHLFSCSETDGVPEFGEPSRSKGPLFIYHVDAVDRAELEGLVLGVEHHVDHGADFLGQDVLCRVEKNSLLQMILERRISSTKTRFTKVSKVLLFGAHL